MLIIPLDRAIDWRRPPVITLTLVALNILVFLFFQLDDHADANRAAQTYVNSGLAAMEVPAFRRHLKTREPETLSEELRKAPDDWPGWMWLIQTNTAFQERLHQGRVVPRWSVDHAEWQRKRSAFEAQYEAITFVGQGLRTALPVSHTLFTHMFLHAGVWHLLGNMLFLVAVGFLVETTLNRYVLLGAYLLSGLGSAAFNFWFDPPGLLPGVGASGAIAGLMGMYAVLYGIRRIRFFYFAGVYFDYVRLPAIVLLPAWIANEVLQMWLYPDSNINYMAHLGGLVTGALIAGAIRYWSLGFDMSHVEREDAQALFDRDLAAARRLCDDFEYRAALPELRRLFDERPDDGPLLHLYHEAAGVDVTSHDYHVATQALLAHMRKDTRRAPEQVRIYRNYVTFARPKPRLKPQSLRAVIPALLETEAYDEAAKALLLLGRHAQPDAELGGFARVVVRAFEARGEAERADPLRPLAASAGSTS